MWPTDVATDAAIAAMFAAIVVAIAAPFAAVTDTIATGLGAIAAITAQFTQAMADTAIGGLCAH